MKLISVELETCHANPDGTAWYAYVEGTIEELEEECGRASLEATFKHYAKANGAPLGLEPEDWEEVPNRLSKHTKLKRYYVGAAV